MKRLRRAPEPTSAMEPWLQKAVDAKLLIEKNTRVRSSDGSKAVARAGSGPCTSTRARPSSAPCAPDAQSTHLPVCPWPPLQWQCGLQGARPSTCASDGPREEECAEGGTL